jgi:hypothetical protein
MDEATVDKLERMLNQILKDEHYGLSSYDLFRERRKEFIRELVAAARGGVISDVR